MGGSGTFNRLRVALVGIAQPGARSLVYEQIHHITHQLNKTFGEAVLDAVQQRRNLPAGSPWNLLSLIMDRS